jgi:putative endonuclease
MPMNAAVYILASQRQGTIYVGVTSNLIRRVWEHKHGINAEFTSRYGVKYLVWYEICEDIKVAIVREKQLKKWNRAWKVRLIEEMNPEWRDLWPGLVGGEEEPDGYPPPRV